MKYDLLLESVVEEFVKQGLFIKWQNDEQIVVEPWSVFGGDGDEVLAVVDINGDMIIAGAELKRIVRAHVEYYNHAPERVTYKKLAETIVWHIIYDYRAGRIKNGFYGGE